MKEMNLSKVIQTIVPRCDRLLAPTGSSIQLSRPFTVSSFHWHDRSLERLAERLTRQASLAVDPGEPVRISIRERTKMRDLEKFFRINPSHWVQLRIAWRRPAGFETDARQILEDLGYRCEEWIGVVGSWPQLGSFSMRSKSPLKLLLWTQWHNNVQKCDLLIPVLPPPLTAITKSS